ncbi:spermidine/putrescine ABC transporter substrate-binding protein [Desulfurivibrio sp. D14AmB]|uniref:polyamine ABC transporter substrate-binding protein n=1 Tax=Desulfurivibrio sp. D14AmB TaxID=3374370 RepID=UPI00376ED6B5
MRKIALLSLSLLLALVVPVLAAEPQRELILLNWSDYLDPDLVKRFEAAHNAKLTQVLYASDEQRTEQLLETDGRGYDLILTSGIDLGVYVRRGWVAPLEVERLPNLKHMSPRWRRVFPDAERYAVPYFWGTLGIAYRRDLVDTPVTSWRQLFEPAAELRGKIAMLSSPRDVVAAALKALGFSVNSEDREALERVRGVLRAQRPHVHSYLYISMDEESSLVKGEVVAAMAYNGDALMLAQHNENIVYVLPEEGSVIWVDYLVVARHAKNPALAHAFLNFINEPENAAQMANFVYYATPNLAAEKLLDPEFLADRTIYPDESSLLHSEFYQPLSPRGQRLWYIAVKEILQ